MIESGEFQRSAAVYWGSYPGETLEKVMAVMLGQEHRGALRRTPSSGDGGVDVLIDDEVGGWHVRQVKGFVGRMDANRRKKVEKSYADLLTDPRLERPITRWSLTVPIDPTSGEQQWFEKMTADAPFPCNWDGESCYTVFEGIPVTTPLRTIIDIAPDFDRGQLERMVQDCLDRGLFTIDDARVRLGQPDMALRPGAQLLRGVLFE